MDQPGAMFTNIIKLAIRNLFKRKLFSFINIFGLAAGVASCLVILKYVDFETSYDAFHTNGSRLYRVTRTVFQGNEEQVRTITTTYGLGPALASDFPEVKLPSILACNGTCLSYVYCCSPAFAC